MAAKLDHFLVEWLVDGSVPTWALELAEMLDER